MTYILKSPNHVAGEWYLQSQSGKYSLWDFWKIQCWRRNNQSTPCHTKYENEKQKKIYKTKSGRKRRESQTWDPLCVKSESKTTGERGAREIVGEIMAVFSQV